MINIQVNTQLIKNQGLESIYGIQGKLIMKDNLIMINGIIKIIQAWFRDNAR